MAGVANASSELPNFSDNASIDLVIENDMNLQELAAKFETDISIEPDTDLNLDPTDSLPRDSDSASNSSSLKDNDNTEDSSDDISKPKLSLKNGDTNKSTRTKLSPKDATLKPGKSSKQKTKVTKQENDSHSSKAPSDSDTLSSRRSSSPSSRRSYSPPSKKNPFKMLKKLTKFDKSSKKSGFSSEFSLVAIDKLPQVFVAKYLGHREVSGVTGLHHVRKPVDEMVQQIRTKLDAKEEVQLPFLYVVVSAKGLDLREHPSNKIKGAAPLGSMPIDFISYGVQDIKYWRVFTCIVVRTLSWQTRSATCHAFMCDSAHTGRKMALALGAAFNLYSKKLKAEGKSHNFQVELRPPDELADGLAECDA